MSHSTTKDRNHSIYIIRNSITGKLYVGMTCNPQRRQNEHFRLLGRGTHYNSHLQASYDKHSLLAFEFTIIDKGLSYEQAQNRESFLIQSLGTLDNGYNMTSGDGSPNKGCFDYSARDSDIQPTIDTLLKEDAKNRAIIRQYELSLASQPVEKIPQTTIDEQQRIIELEGDLKAATALLESERKASQQQIDIIKQERPSAIFWLAVIVGITLVVVLVVLGLTVFFAR